MANYFNMEFWGGTTVSVTSVKSQMAKLKQIIKKNWLFLAKCKYMTWWCETYGFFFKANEVKY